MTDITKKHVDQMKEMLEVQGQDGNWNSDSYMHGMYNGMEFMLSIVEDREPVYKKAPDQWKSEFDDEDKEPVEATSSFTQVEDYEPKEIYQDEDGLYVNALVAEVSNIYDDGTITVFVHHFGTTTLDESKLGDMDISTGDMFFGRKTPGYFVAEGRIGKDFKVDEAFMKRESKDD